MEVSEADQTGPAPHDDGTDGGDLEAAPEEEELPGAHSRRVDVEELDESVARERL